MTKWNRFIELLSPLLSYTVGVFVQKRNNVSLENVAMLAAIWVENATLKLVMT